MFTASHRHTEARFLCHLGNNGPVMKWPDSCSELWLWLKLVDRRPFFFVWSIIQSNNAEAFILGFCILFPLRLFDCFPVSHFAASISSSSRLLCELKPVVFHPDSPAVAWGTVTPPHPAVNSVLHNKRPPFRDYTVQDAVDSKQQGWPFTLLVCLPATSPVNEHKGNLSSFIAPAPALKKYLMGGKGGHL